jgi:hypothetical protein
MTMIVFGDRETARGGEGGQPDARESPRANIARSTRSGCTRRWLTPDRHLRDVRETADPGERESFTRNPLLGELLGVPRDRFPSTHRELASYMTSMIASGAVAVDGRASALAALVMRPKLRLLPGPAMIPFEIVTAGLLPASLRDQYGLAWGAAQRRLYRLMVIALPRMVAVTPPVLRVWPLPGHNVKLSGNFALT